MEGSEGVAGALSSYHLDAYLVEPKPFLWLHV